jgi:hypothetical protein
MTQWYAWVRVNDVEASPNVQRAATSGTLRNSRRN